MHANILDFILYSINGYIFYRVSTKVAIRQNEESRQGSIFDVERNQRFEIYYMHQSVSKFTDISITQNALELAKAFFIIFFPLFSLLLFWKMYLYIREIFYIRKSHFFTYSRYKNMILNSSIVVEYVL